MVSSFFPALSVFKGKKEHALVAQKNVCKTLTSKTTALLDYHGRM